MLIFQEYINKIQVQYVCEQSGHHIRGHVQDTPGSSPVLESLTNVGSISKPPIMSPSWLNQVWAALASIICRNSDKLHYNTITDKHHNVLELELRRLGTLTMLLLLGVSGVPSFPWYLLPAPVPDPRDLSFLFCWSNSMILASQ